MGTTARKRAAESGRSRNDRHLLRFCGRRRILDGSESERGQRSRTCTHGEQQPVDTSTPEYLRRHVLEHHSDDLRPPELISHLKVVKEGHDGRDDKMPQTFVHRALNTGWAWAIKNTGAGEGRAFTSVWRTHQSRRSATPRFDFQNCPSRWSWKPAVPPAGRGILRPVDGFRSGCGLRCKRGLILWVRQCSRRGRFGASYDERISGRLW